MPKGETRLISGVAVRMVDRGPVGASKYASADASRHTSERDVDATIISRGR